MTGPRILQLPDPSAMLHVPACLCEQGVNVIASELLRVLISLWHNRIVTSLWVTGCHGTAFRHCVIIILSYRLLRLTIVSSKGAFVAEIVPGFLLGPTPLCSAFVMPARSRQGWASRGDRDAR